MTMPLKLLEDALNRIAALRERVGDDPKDSERAAVSRALDEVSAMLVDFQTNSCGRLEGILEEHGTELRRLRAASARKVLEEERSRHAIAAELQSGLGQYLALAKYRLAALRETDDVELSGEIAQIEALIDSADASLRAVTMQISPPSLFDLGLVSGLEWLAEKMDERFELAVEIVDDDSPTVESEGLRVLVYHCVREFLLNVARHAHVDHAIVQLSAHDDALQVQVVDEGCGFDPQAFESAGHGIFELREQLINFRGSLDVASSPGNGTSVLVRVPVAQHSERGSLTHDV